MSTTRSAWRCAACASAGVNRTSVARATARSCATVTRGSSDTDGERALTWRHYASPSRDARDQRERETSFTRLAEVERAAGAHLGDDVEAVGREELLTRMRGGDAILLDVRPHEEYDAGQIEGARSIPIDELERRL